MRLKAVFLKRLRRMHDHGQNIQAARAAPPAALSRLPLRLLKLP